MKDQAKNSPILRFLTSGKLENPRDQAVNDTMTRYVILNVALMLGAFFLLSFGFTAFIAGNISQGLFDFTVALICIASVCLLRTKLSYTVSAMLPVGAFTVLCAALVFSGGVNGFAGLWIYAQPLIAIFILGLRGGATLSALLLGAIGIFAFVPNAGFAYELPAGFRLFCVFILVFVLTIAYEWVRVTKDTWLKKLTEELEAARQKAEDAATAKSNFLANTSHEIRTPMNAILGMTELILRRDISAETYADTLSIKQAGESLLAIINDILDISKIESGKMELVPGDYYFESLIKDVVNIICLRLGEKHIRFITNVDCRIPAKLYGDMVRIRQVLLNLLTNAVKYTEKGYIKLTVTPEISGEDITLTFEVADSGFGIQEGELDRLFGDFSRIDSHKNRSIEGTGLGLAISRNLCRIMGGDISVQSKYGEGSVFTAVIPQKVHDDHPIAGVEKGDTKEVLLYERRDIYRESVIWSLKNLGVPLTVTTKGELFTELAKKDWPFVFISPDVLEAVQQFVEEKGKKTAAVLLAKREEDEFFRYTPTISIPAYTPIIANVLNGVREAKQEKKSLVRFTAPKARILIVDDISTNLNVARGLLEPYKMNVSVCTSGREAIDLVRNSQYDLVLMDHMMPEMDGIEATAAIRAMAGEYFQSLPIIALTANAVTGMKEMFLANGFNDFISKPIEVAKLDAMMAKWIKIEKKIKIEGAPVPEAPAETTSLSIEGVDTARGLAMTGGTEAGYRKVLASFRKDAAERLPGFESLFETIPDEKTLSLFTTNVHALKSAAGTIGAVALSKAAAELEKAGNAGDRGLIAEKLPGFCGELKGLTERIGLALNTGTAGSGESVDQYLPLFTELSGALEQEDIRTIRRILTELEGKSFDAKTKEILNTVSNDILMSEFEEAAEAFKVLTGKQTGEAHKWTAG
ncbi:hypothetical protein AGMMS49546_18090 [Spirochaetia bacterium]|nr:hypothetical protein AGMMS49546_18090 [Spirochaetia bacterium]